MLYESCAMLHFKRLGLIPKFDVWRLFQQRQPVRTLMQDKKPLLIRKHWAQPHFNMRVRHERIRRRDARFRLYWKEIPMVEEEPSKKVPSSRPSASKYFPDPNNRTPKTAGSLTQLWLSRMVYGGLVIPRYLSRLDFPARDVSGFTPPPGLQRKRTEKDRRRVEAVLTTSITSLAEWISPEMMNMIEKSPFTTRDKYGSVLVFRSHRLWTRGENLQECYRILQRFLRNVASEIVYREQRIEADEMKYREEGAIDDPE